MQKLLQNYTNYTNKSLKPSTELIQFQASNKDEIFASRNNLGEKPQSTSKSLIQSATTAVNDWNNNQNEFVTATVYSSNSNAKKRLATESVVSEPSPSNSNARKRLATESVVSEPSPKKILTTKNVENKPNVNEKCEARTLTGDVSQTLHLNKKYPNTKAFYEVYGIVYKIHSKDRQKILLLRNDVARGPVLKGIYFEIDDKMVEVQPGDRVRCVGKIVNGSWIHLFKVSTVEHINHQLVQRLFALCSYSMIKSSNH